MRVGFNPYQIKINLVSGCNFINLNVSGSSSRFGWTRRSRTRTRISYFNISFLIIFNINTKIKKILSALVSHITTASSKNQSQTFPSSSALLLIKSNHCVSPITTFMALFIIIIVVVSHRLSNYDMVENATFIIINGIGWKQHQNDEIFNWKQHKRWDIWLETWYRLKTPPSSSSGRRFCFAFFSFFYLFISLIWQQSEICKCMIVPTISPSL